MARLAAIANEVSEAAEEGFQRRMDTKGVPSHEALQAQAEAARDRLAPHAADVCRQLGVDADWCDRWIPGIRTDVISVDEAARVANDRNMVGAYAEQSDAGTLATVRNRVLLGEGPIAGMQARWGGATVAAVTAHELCHTAMRHGVAALDTGAMEEARERGDPALWERFEGPGGAPGSKATLRAKMHSWEHAADACGQELMERAGYPRGAYAEMLETVGAWQATQEMEREQREESRQGGGGLASLWRKITGQAPEGAAERATEKVLGYEGPTHPSLGERIDRARAREGEGNGQGLGSTEEGKGVSGRLSARWGGYEPEPAQGGHAVEQKVQRPGNNQGMER